MSRYLCLLFILTFSHSLKAELIAFDLTDSGSQNRLSYQNQFTGGFSSSQDAFHVVKSNDLLFAPEQFLDRSHQAADSLGLVDVTESNFTHSFVVSDTVNSDHNLGFLSAIWTFDISGYQNIELSMAVAAMGDFETSDKFSFSYAFDNNAHSQIWSSSVDTASSFEYQMADGKMVRLNDPLKINGKVVSDQFSLLNKSIAGFGDSLSLIFSAKADGGSEVFAFNNLKVYGEAKPAQPVPEPQGIFFIALTALIFTQLCREYWF